MYPPFPNKPLCQIFMNLNSTLDFSRRDDALFDKSLHYPSNNWNRLHVQNFFWIFLPFVLQTFVPQHSANAKMTSFFSEAKFVGQFLCLNTLFPPCCTKGYFSVIFHYTTSFISTWTSNCWNKSCREVSFIHLLCIPWVHGTSRFALCSWLSDLLLRQCFCICYVGNISFFLSIYTLLMFPDVNHRTSGCNQLTVSHLF